MKANAKASPEHDFDAHLDGLVRAGKRSVKAYSYIRFSSPAQSEGDSLRRQTALRDAWIAKRGVTLDTSLNLQDLGISAFRGKNLTHGALAGFVAAVKQGRVPKGSYLIVEKLDRFSRADADEALPIFTQLVKAGITIVTLEPEKEWNAETIRNFGLIELVLHFILAHEESEKKSTRLAAAWGDKRRNAATELLTSRMPGWLVVKDGKPAINPPVTKIIKRIFDLAEVGHGTSQIAKLLNREKTPALGWGVGWHGASIGKILRSRSPLGEYQPCKITPQGPKRRVPVGEPVPGYYPAIVMPTQWERVQAALDSRKYARGKVGRAVSNLFQGIVKDARDGGNVKLKQVGRCAYLLPNNADRGLAGDKFSFHYPTFERSILHYLREIKPADLAPPTKTDDGAQDAIGRLAEVDRRIAKTKARLAGDGDFDSLLDVLSTLEVEKQELTAAIAAATKTTPEIQRRDLAAAVDLLDQVDNADGDELLDLRSRLKQLIRGLIKEVYILVEPWGESKICFAQVCFSSGVVRTIWAMAKGKGLTHFKGKPLDFAVGNRGYWPTGLHDLRKYATDALVRGAYEDTMANLAGTTPKAQAIKRIKAGEKPYRIAKEFGVATSTMYHWLKEIRRRPKAK